MSHVQVVQLLSLSILSTQLMLSRLGCKFRVRLEEPQSNIMVSQGLLKLSLLTKELLLFTRVFKQLGWERHHIHPLDLDFMNLLKDGLELTNKMLELLESLLPVHLLVVSDLWLVIHLMFWRQEWWLTRDLSQEVSATFSMMCIRIRVHEVSTKVLRLT